MSIGGSNEQRENWPTLFISRTGNDFESSDDVNPRTNLVVGEKCIENSVDGQQQFKEEDVRTDDNKEESTTDLQIVGDSNGAQGFLGGSEDHLLTQECVKNEESFDSNTNEKPNVVLDDTVFVAEAVKEEADGAKDGLSELKRLRQLVFASRGSRSNLPAGWDDDVVEDNKQTSATRLQSTNTSQGQEEKATLNQTDEAAQRMLQRAIDVVGQYASDSDSESDSDSSSSSSSSSLSLSLASTSQSNKAKGKSPKGKQHQALSDDEEEGGGGIGPHGPTTKNEVIEPTVDLPPYSIVPMEKEIRPLGKIHSIVDCVVVVAQDVGKAPGQHNQSHHQAGQSHGYRSAPVDMHGRKGEEEGEYSVLDTGSLLTFADRNVLGVVFETFGSVLSPLYALRYSSASQVNRDMIEIGKQVYYIPSDSTYVLTRALRALGKGSDASNLWDEEVGDDEKEFSDDEAEAEYKRNTKVAKGKGKKRGHSEQEHGKGSNGGGTTWSGPNGIARPIKHSLPMRPAMAPPTHRDAADSQNILNLPYDDDEQQGSGSSAALVYPPLPAMHSTPVSHDPYAMWAYQQQQQQQQIQYQPNQQFPAAYPQHYYTTGQPQPLHHSTIPSQPSNDSYDPQQPLFGSSQPPSWPHPPSY